MLKNIALYYFLNGGVLAGIIVGMRYLPWEVSLPLFFGWCLIYRPLLDFGRLHSLGVLTEKEEKSFWSRTFVSPLGYKYFRSLYFGVR